MERARFLSLIFLVISVSLTGCGVVKLGPGASPNDPLPVGTIVAQSNFNGVNSQTVSGTAVLYKLDSSGEIVVRIEGLTAPTENALQIRGIKGGTLTFQNALRASTGTQNYVTSLTDGTGWNSVSIYSSLNAKDYGTASF